MMLYAGGDRVDNGHISRRHCHQITIYLMLYTELAGGFCIASVAHMAATR